MMAFLLCLIVFAITCNNGTARPTTECGDINIKPITQNRINSEEHTNLGDIFNLPAIIKPGVTITIKGHLKPTDKLFKVVLYGNQKTNRQDEEEKINENSTITFDFGSKVITFTSAEESITEEYSLRQQKEETFSLRINARSDGLVNVDFEVNHLGKAPVIWDMGDISNIKYIEVQEGVEHTDSLLFELFKNNR